MPGTPLNVRRAGRGEGVGGRGGSLERRNSPDGRARPPAEAFSDSEYMRGAERASSPGTKSLPKKSSALNYGLLLGQIQQKRQQRKQRSVDGSVSDSNYGCYSDLGSSSPYGWLQPSSLASAAQYCATGWTGQAEEDRMGSSESLNSVSSSIQQARAHSLTRYRAKLSLGSQQEREEEPSSQYYGVPFQLLQTAKQGRPGSNSSYSSLPAYPASQQGGAELAGSHASLLSTNSSLYSSQEDKTNADIAKLQRELVEEHQKVVSLTSQLATNAHVVSAFEQSLANMTARLQQITRTAEKKDSELSELRRTIERLRESGAEAGLCRSGKEELSGSTSSLCSGDEAGRGREAKQGKGSRNGWLRSSFSKAFSKGRSRSKSGSVSDCEEGGGGQGRREVGEAVVLAEREPPMSTPQQERQEEEDPGLVSELKKQLLEKDTLLTETRLEALSSVHQLESMKETVSKMKCELSNLKQDNAALASQVTHGNKSLGSSQSSLNTSHECGAGAVEEVQTAGWTASSLDLSGTTDPVQQDSRAVLVVLELGPGRPALPIGHVGLGGALGWQLLDGLVSRLLSEYLLLVDPLTSLGVDADSVLRYRLGEQERQMRSSTEPELLPCGYLVGEVDRVVVELQEADRAALASLVPRSILQRYLGLLRDHRRLVLAGPPQSGKSEMAAAVARLQAGQLGSVARLQLLPGQDNTAALEELLAKVQGEARPSLILLDNLQHAPQLEPLLQELAGDPALPPIVATLVQQAGVQHTELQLRCSFRWVLVAAYMEPARGYLGRALRARLLQHEVETRQHCAAAHQITHWLGRAFLAINKFLESAVCCITASAKFLYY